MKRFLIAAALLCLVGAPAEAQTFYSQCPSSMTACQAAHITTATTTTVKTGPGIIHLLSVNTAQASSTATIYDNTAASGTVLAVIDTSSAKTVLLDIGFNTGLTIVTVGATPADITVAFR